MASERRLIDANAFHAYLEDLRQDYIAEDSQSSDFAAEVIETVQDVYLANAPTVDAVEVVHGQWIEILSGQNSSGYECSICKRIVSVVSDVDLRERVLAKKYPYCHCGAKMDGGADNGI